MEEELIAEVEQGHSHRGPVWDNVIREYGRNTGSRS